MDFEKHFERAVSNLSNKNRNVYFLTCLKKGWDMILNVNDAINFITNNPWVSIYQLRIMMSFPKEEYVEGFLKMFEFKVVTVCKGHLILPNNVSTSKISIFTDRYKTAANYLDALDLNFNLCYFGYFKSNTWNLKIMWALCNTYLEKDLNDDIIPTMCHLKIFKNDHDEVETQEWLQEMNQSFSTPRYAVYNSLAYNWNNDLVALDNIHGGF